MEKIYILKRKPVEIVVDLYNDAFKRGIDVDDISMLDKLDRYCVPVDIDEMVQDWIANKHGVPFSWYLKEKVTNFGDQLISQTVWQSL